MTRCRSASFRHRYRPAPNPNGFIEASTLSTNIKNRALAGHLSTVKLIGVYYPPDALATILHAGYTEPTAFCIAFVEKEFETAKAADDYFNRLVKNAKKEGEQKFDRNDAAIDRIEAL